MVIYGYRSTKVNHALLPDQCPSCGSYHAVEAYVFQTYAHIFWVPIFPFMKTGALQCSNCQMVFKPKQLPEPLKSSFKSLKTQSKTPLWTFSGAAIIALLIFWGIREADISDNNTAKFIAAPAVGDVLEVKSSDTSYTLYKIGLVEKDSVYIYPNLYETDKESGLMQLTEKGDTAYEANLYGFSKSELQQMLKRGEILAATRHEDILKK